MEAHLTTHTISGMAEICILTSPPTPTGMEEACTTTYIQAPITTCMETMATAVYTPVGILILDTPSVDKTGEFECIILHHVLKFVENERTGCVVLWPCN